MLCKGTNKSNTHKEICKLFFFLCHIEYYFVPSSEAMIDAVIEAEEGFSAMLQAAWDDGGAKEDAAIWVAVDATAKGKTGMRGFHEEGHLSVEEFAIHYYCCPLKIETR